MFPNLYVRDPPHLSATQQTLAAHLGPGSSAAVEAVFEYVPPTKSRRASSVKPTSRRKTARSSTESSRSTIGRAKKVMGRLTAGRRTTHSFDEAFDKSTLDGASSFGPEGNAPSIDTSVIDRESIHEGKLSLDQSAARDQQHCKSKGSNDQSESSRQRYQPVIPLSMQNKNVDHVQRHKQCEAARPACPFDSNRSSQQDAAEKSTDLSVSGSSDGSTSESQFSCFHVPSPASRSKSPICASSSIERDRPHHARSTPYLHVDGCITSSSSSSPTAGARTQSLQIANITSLKRRAVLLNRNWPPIVPVRMDTSPPPPQWEQHPPFYYEDLTKPRREVSPVWTPVSTPRSFPKTPSPTTPQASTQKLVIQQDDDCDLSVGSFFARREWDVQQHPYRCLRQPLSAPPAPLHPEDSPTLPGLRHQAKNQRASASSFANGAPATLPDPTRRPISSRTSSTSLNNRHAWYLQDDDLSVLSAVGGSLTQERQFHAVASTDSSDSQEAEEKTPTLRATRCTGSKEKQQRRKTDGIAWRRYQEKVMAGDELHADGQQRDEEASIAAAATTTTTASRKVSLSDRTHAQHEPSSSTTAPLSSAPSEPSIPPEWCFPPERIALRRMDDIVLTDEDMSLLEVMGRETYSLSIKRQEDIRKRQELLAMKYEVPIPRSSQSAKRTRVHDPVETTATTTSARRGSVSGAFASPTLQRLPSKWKVRLSVGAKTPSTSDLGADTSPSDSGKSKSVDGARPPIKWMAPPSPWSPSSFTSSPDIRSPGREQDPRQSISEHGRASSIRSRSGSIKASWSTPRSASLFPFVDPFGTQTLSHKESSPSIKSPTKQTHQHRDEAVWRQSVSSARDGSLPSSPSTPRKPSHLFPLPDPFGSHTVKPKRSTGTMSSFKAPDKISQKSLDQRRRDSSSSMAKQQQQQEDASAASMARLSQLLTPPNLLILPRHSFTAPTSAPAKEEIRGGGDDGGGGEGSSSSFIFRRQQKTTRKRSCTVGGSSAPPTREGRA